MHPQQDDVKPRLATYTPFADYLPRKLSGHHGQAACRLSELLRIGRALIALGVQPSDIAGWVCVVCDALRVLDGYRSWKLTVPGVRRYLPAAFPVTDDVIVAAIQRARRLSRRAIVINSKDAGEWIALTDQVRAYIQATDDYVLRTFLPVNESKERCEARRKARAQEMKRRRMGAENRGQRFDEYNLATPASFSIIQENDHVVARFRLASVAGKVIAAIVSGAKTTSEIAEVCGVCVNPLHQALSRLVARKLIEKVGHGRYRALVVRARGSARPTEPHNSVSGANVASTIEIAATASSAGPVIEAGREFERKPAPVSAPVEDQAACPIVPAAPDPQITVVADEPSDGRGADRQPTRVMTTPDDAAEPHKFGASNGRMTAATLDATASRRADRRKGKGSSPRGKTPNNTRRRQSSRHGPPLTVLAAASSTRASTRSGAGLVSGPWWRTPPVKRGGRAALERRQHTGPPVTPQWASRRIG
jgi:hypothetical protein